MPASSSDEKLPRARSTRRRSVKDNAWLNADRADRRNRVLLAILLAAIFAVGVFFVVRGLAH